MDLRTLGFGCALIPTIMSLWLHMRRRGRGKNGGFSYGIRSVALLAIDKKALL
jgi:hypothetical protein